MGDAGRDNRTPSNGVPEKQRLRVSLLGGDPAWIGNCALDLKQRKVVALLGLLALNENHRSTRERIVGLLWSEVPEEKAKTSLRQALHLLRQQFDSSQFTGFYTDRMQIALNPDYIQVDVWDVVLNAEDGIVNPALLRISQFSERILEGFEDLDPSFRVWLLARRQSLQERLLSALERILARGPSNSERFRAAEALINLDRTHEEAVRFLMLARAATGNISAALKLYNTLWQLLDEDYDMEPSAETQSLVAEIKRGVVDPAALNWATGAPIETRRMEAPPVHLACNHNLVLAVEPVPGDHNASDGQHLLQGFRHAIIGCMVRFREWRVMDLMEPLSSGESQGAHFVIQSTALQLDHGVSVILTLKDLRSDVFIWSEQFELHAEVWAAVLRRVVRSITAAFNVHLSVRRMSHLAGDPTVSSHLYDRWLRGQALISRLEPEDWDRASRLFCDVIREAPEFAPAYSSLVQLKNSQHIVHPGVYRDKSRQSEALDLARIATALDPIDSRTQLCMAWAFAFDGQYDKSELHFELAESLNEYDPWTLMSTAQGFAFLADGERATKLADRALDNLIEPQPLHWSYLAGIRYFVGDYRDAYEAAVQAGDFLSNNGAWRAAALVRLGQEDMASAEVQRCLGIVRERWRSDHNPSDEEISRWVMDLFPIRSEVQREALCRDLATAGFPAV